MLNDVHVPPVETGPAIASLRPHRPVAREQNDANTDRVRDRVPTAVRSDVPEAIYGEPEDRGDSFNTMMSASIVVIVVVSILGVASAMFL